MLGRAGHFCSFLLGGAVSCAALLALMPGAGLQPTSIAPAFEASAGKALPVGSTPVVAEPDTGRTVSPDARLRIERAAALFRDISLLVETQAAEGRLDEETLGRMADAALQAVDPWSHFIPATKAEEEGSEASPDLWVGFRAADKAGHYVVESVAVDGPADAAGLRPGERIISIEGTNLAATTPSEINDRLRAAMNDNADKTVILGVEVEGQGSREISIALRSMDSTGVSDLGIRDRVLHLHLDNFALGSAAAVSRAIERASNASKIRGVVLDLRGNPGGRTDEAAAILELFLPKDALLYEMTGRQFGVRRVLDQTEEEHAELGLAVLVNGHSASASEIVAGAIQAHRRGMVVGWNTHGKGSVQRVFPVAGGAIAVTHASYRDGGLRQIAGNGVRPDIPIDAPDPGRRKSSLGRDSARDVAIKAAIPGQQKRK